MLDWKRSTLTFRVRSDNLLSIHSSNETFLWVRTFEFNVNIAFITLNSVLNDYSELWAYWMHVDKQSSRLILEDYRLF